MSNQFDDISKKIAAGTSRRGMFKMLGVGVAGAVFTAFRSTRTDAAPASCLSTCKGMSGATLLSCVSACTCEAEGFHVCGKGRSRLCCSPKNTCVGVNETSLSINGKPGLCLPIPEVVLG